MRARSSGGAPSMPIRHQRGGRTRAQLVEQELGRGGAAGRQEVGRCRRGPSPPRRTPGTAANASASRTAQDGQRAPEAHRGGRLDRHAGDVAIGLDGLDSAQLGTLPVDPHDLKKPRTRAIARRRASAASRGRSRRSRRV